MSWSSASLREVRYEYKYGYATSPLTDPESRRWAALDAVRDNLSRSIAHDVAFGRQHNAAEVELLRRICFRMDRLYGSACAFDL